MLDSGGMYKVGCVGSGGNGARKIGSGLGSLCSGRLVLQNLGYLSEQHAALGGSSFVTLNLCGAMVLSW